MSTPLCPPEIDSVADLKALQRLMAGMLFAPLNPRGDHLAATDSEGTSVKVLAESFIKPNRKLSSRARLEIYARQYWYRLLDNLHDDFPALRALLGNRKFHKFCRAYLAKYQSGSWTLRNLGSRLERFILEHPDLTAPWTTAAADVCRLEWAQTVAFDEIHYPVPEGDSLLGGDPARITLGLQPSVTLMRADYAVDAFFFAARKAEAGSRDASSGAVSGPGSEKKAPLPRCRKPRAESCYLAVHRYENSVYIKRMDPVSWRLLSALRDGATVAEAVGAALELADPEVDWIPQIRAWFENWAQLGWFCDPSHASRHKNGSEESDGDYFPPAGGLFSGDAVPA